MDFKVGDRVIDDNGRKGKIVVILKTDTHYPIGVYYRISEGGAETYTLDGRQFTNGPIVLRKLDDEKI